MTKSSFNLGVDESDRQLQVSIADFTATNTLIVGQTRSGKSHATRLLIEKTHGIYPQFVFDREGEYVTLREQFDFVVIGEDWDFDASPEIAGDLAVRLLQMGASAIIDLSGIRHKTDLEFVCNFVNGLIDLKRKDWQDAMLVFDEAHLLAPEGKETPCGLAIIDVAKRGLKRGLFSVFTTQRLPEISKAVVNQCNNVMTGRAVDIDAKRSAGRLRLNKDQVEQLHMLKRGRFFVGGPALTDQAQLVLIHDTKTHAPDRRSRKNFELAPAKGAVLAALAELSQVEDEAEEKRDEVENLRERVRGLEAQIRTRPQPTVDMTAVNDLRRQKTELEGRVSELVAHHNVLMRQLSARVQEFSTEIERSTGLPDKFTSKLPEVKLTTTPQSAKAAMPTTTSNGEIPKGAMALLQAVVQFYPKSIPLRRALAMAKISPRSSNVGRYRKELLEAGLIEINGTGLSSQVSATGVGVADIGDYTPFPTDVESMLSWARSLLDPSTAKLLQAIYEHPGIDRGAQLDFAGISHTSSNAGRCFKELRSFGFIEQRNGRFSISTEFYS